MRRERRGPSDAHGDRSRPRREDGRGEGEKGGRPGAGRRSRSRGAAGARLAAEARREDAAASEGPDDATGSLSARRALCPIR